MVNEHARVAVAVAMGGGGGEEHGIVLQEGEWGGAQRERCAGSGHPTTVRPHLAAAALTCTRCSRCGRGSTDNPVSQ